MRIYISGPCSGVEDDNFPAFRRAREKLEAAGYVALDPTAGSVPISAGRKDEAWLQSAAYEAALAAGMVLLETAEGIAMLPGWRGSNGAEREHFRATCKGLPVGSVEDWVQRKCGRSIRWVGSAACGPVRHFAGDAGFDLAVAEFAVVPAGQAKDVSLGIRVQMPTGTWGLLTGRSSTLRKRGLLVAQGVIDQGYRGPLFAYCHNLNGRTVRLEVGERIAQLIPMTLAAEGIGLLGVEELEASDRGERSFGSTGGFAMGVDSVSVR